MTRFLHRLVRGLLASAAAALILVAALSLAVRLLLPHAEGLRETIVTRLSETLGVEVEVGTLAVRMRGFSPQLAFADARLRSGADAAHPEGRLLLATRALRVDLDLLSSLAAWRPRIAAITLVGAEIQIVRDHDGRLRVLGLDAMQGDDVAALDFFLRQGRFRLLDSRLHWRDAMHPDSAPDSAQAFCIEVAELSNQGTQHRLRIRLRPDADPSGELQLLGALAGAAEAPDQWSGTLYLGWLGSDIGGVANPMLPGPLAVASATLQLESWNRLANGRLAESLTRFDISDLALARRAGGPRHRLGSVSGLARWQRQATGWQADVQQLRFPGTRAGTTRARVGFRHPAERAGAGADSGPRLYGAIGSLPIAPVADTLAWLGPELPDAIGRLAAAGVHGRARDLALHLRLAASAPDPRGSHLGSGPGSTGQLRAKVADWRLQADLQGLGIGSGAGIPRFSGVDLRVEAGTRGGRIHLGSDAAEIDLQPLFAHPHRFTHLSGDLAWRWMPAGSIHLWTEALRADTANVETLTRLSLCAHPSGASPFVDLHTRLRHGRIAGLSQWLPVGIMDDRVEDWLERAIVAGRVESGDLLFRGALEHFPFDDQQGRFLLVLRALDGVLDYGVDAPRRTQVRSGSLPDAAGARSAEPAHQWRWPALRDVAATVRFENRRLEIEVPSATILGTQVESGRAWLENLWQPRYFEIEAKGSGPLADGIEVLSTTPLARELGGLAAAVSVSGDGALALALGVPLSRGLPFRYQGELRLAPPASASHEPSTAQAQTGNRDAQAGAETVSAGMREGTTPGQPSDGRTTPTLAINGTDVVFSAIDGSLRFGADGLTADGIGAELGEQRLRVDVTTRDGGSAAARTEIIVRGRTAAERLAQRLPATVTRLLAGAIDWRLALTLRNRDASVPDPPIAFRLTSDLRGFEVALPAPIGKARGARRALALNGRYQAQWPLPLELRYGDAGARLELERADDGPIRLRRAALALDGLPSSLPNAGTVRIGGQLAELELGPWLDWASRQRRRGDGSSATDIDLELQPIRLRVGDLRLGALQLTDVDAQLTPEAGAAWRIRFDAAESGVGRVQLPRAGDSDALRIGLQRFDIAPLVEAQAAASAAQEPATPADPRRLGRIELEIERLQYATELLGQLQLRTAPRANGLRLEQLTLAGPHVQASGRGEWLIDATDYVETSIALSADSDAIGELLRESGFYSALSEAPGRVVLDLSWPGGPGNLSLARARGTLAIDIGAGRMLDMEPGVGRMLGILNSGALRRRLSLDFSDVFEDGFSFDRISGEIGIGSGAARIRELEIVAPPADIRITGRTDLVERRFDQRVEVTPKIGTGVALASAVAGGPVVGAAVFLADKVTDGGLERLGRYAYRVEGPWQEPIITRVGTNGVPSVGDLFVDDNAASGPAARSASDAPAAGGATAPARSTAAPPAASRERAPAADALPDNPFLEGF